MLCLAGCAPAAVPPAPPTPTKTFLTLDRQGIQLRDQRMAWGQLTHLTEVTLQAPEGPFTQLVATDRKGRSLTLCASFTASPTPDSTAATLAGDVAISDDQLENVREAICRAAGLEMLEVTAQGPVYGRTQDSRPGEPPEEPLKW